MNGATNDDPIMTNGEDHLVDDLETWATGLADAAKAYKSASGQESLALRHKMTGIAKQIINAVKEPGETCFEHSVQVWIAPSRGSAVCLLNVDGRNGSASYAHGAQSLRQDSSTRKHLI